jgi:hypothetical protein
MDDDLTSLAWTIEAAGLGPTTTVRLLPSSDPDRVASILVELDPASPDKARILARWLETITVWDAIAGKLRASDTKLRLSVRGQFPSGSPVIVVAAFDEQTESAQADLIADQIKRQEIPELVHQLVEIETRRPAPTDQL